MNTETTMRALVDSGIATQAELQLVTDINGYSLDTLSDVLYARTGDRDLAEIVELYA